MRHLGQGNHDRAPQQTKATKQTHHTESATRKTKYTQSVPITNNSKETETETDSDRTLTIPGHDEQPGAMISPRAVAGSDQTFLTARIEAIRTENRYRWTVTADWPNVQQRRRLLIQNRTASAGDPRNHGRLDGPTAHRPIDVTTEQRRTYERFKTRHSTNSKTRNRIKKHAQTNARRR
jgi:hypothetical protein